ncbi:flagellar hook-basal body complex protein, partial [Bradyrhizobium sp.]|uniref:flagellar hook protein FlgE n=1 Tax=Bradyrhizobium sp. TaxID=376 RepID=UPI002DFCA800|nr:flagellar hook-basal body complex protein [Bradyrhizobium sp.]
MGIFDALNTSVGGLQAQSFALQNISGNIANAQTTGFKGINTSFVDLVPEATNPDRQVAGGVTAYARQTVSTQGTVSASSVGTFMAINGDGFFSVQKASGTVDNAPVFTGVTNYTRRGDFQVNANGNLVNGAGYYLMGVAVDSKTGNPLGNVPQVLQFQNSFVPAQATTTIQYGLNLPATPVTAASSTAPAGTITAVGGLDATVFTPDPTVAGSGTVVGNDAALFQNQSISGGAVTAYDASGTPVNLQLRWAKTDSAAIGGTDTWNLFYQKDPTATGAAVAWVNAGTDFTFGTDGKLTSPTTPSITLTGVAVGGQTLGNVSVSIGAAGLTQYATTGGTATINTISQNGYPAGQLQSVAISNSGLVIGTFSNGQNINLASVTLSHFNGTNYLKSLDGGAYAVTDQSGAAITGASGSISGSSLEGSNTDIADEFTKLIVTQQAYSANTKVITTANSMVQDLLNV